MNRSTLKNYAPKARQDFIHAVTQRAAWHGITKNRIEPLTEQGDVAVIQGRVFPRSIIEKRKKLTHRIETQGFEHVMEAYAYTWFNRFVAIRYMELHGYLDHGYRVLSHPDGKETPEILEYADRLTLPGLNHEKVIEWKLDGQRENDLYRMILIAQCNALNHAMPFLFGRVDDEAELLLPENLLNTDSLLRKLVKEVDESSWQEVEIIGWLYQFYISEKKDQVIGSVVKSEDIPAATQLFTPNWIVKYMVQNTLGRKWLATYPDSSIRAEMDFYIEPAEQEPEVIEQLKAITPDSLNPEEITFLDPACGSGHILVEAYELFKRIYQERGYRLRDIPAKVLENNLYGLEIDDRAAQLASLSLLMKARADDRQIFDRGIQPRVISIQETNGMDVEQILNLLTGQTQKTESSPFAPEDMFPTAHRQPFLMTATAEGAAESNQWLRGVLQELIECFQDAKTYGSLITIPETLIEQLPRLNEFLGSLDKKDMWVQKGIEMIEGYVLQAERLQKKYAVVVANPPYMGSKYINTDLKHFLKLYFKGFEKDVFSAFVVRNINYTERDGHSGFMCPFNWMFISSFEELRNRIIDNHTLLSLIRPEFHAFFDSAFVTVCTFVLQKSKLNWKGSFIDLTKFYGEDVQPQKTLEAIRNPACGWFYTAKPDDFKKIPGSPIAYWVSERIREIFATTQSLGEIAEVRQGLATGDNDRFMRLWHEVSISKIGFGYSLEEATNSPIKWFPYNKGGAFRKWYGNLEYIVNWENNGYEIRNFYDERGQLKSRPQNTQYFFRDAISWTLLSSSYFGIRYMPKGAIFDINGMSCFSESGLEYLIAFMGSNLCVEFLKIINPTLAFQVGDIKRLPLVPVKTSIVTSTISKLINVAKIDWDSQETSWYFEQLPIIKICFEELSGHRDMNYRRPALIENTYVKLKSYWKNMIAEVQKLEEDNNRAFISVYGLDTEIRPDVSVDEITLLCNPSFRYGGDSNYHQIDVRILQDTIKGLGSYSIGCMMGRYSLDKPGLIYAHSGNTGFDPSNYTTFPADADGIIPITDMEWFDDDAANRFIKFVSIAWPKEHLEENLEFIADSLDRKNTERPRETIRRYFQNSFFKDHLKTYKKRPIYWLFTSGKQKAFQCLVYLHRYNEGTLARMRTEYVILLQGKITSRIEQLSHDLESAQSPAHLKKLKSEKETLLKQQDELLRFDEKLRHYADMRISIDLDDGVKVNYGKFGDLLADVKAVTGGSEE